MPTPLPTLVEMTAQIASAHCANNQLPADALPVLIREIYRALAGAGTPLAPPADKPEPVVPIKRSVFPDYIICLEDGKKLKMLKRHLQASYGMTPKDYRERWGLPPNYPMTAPNYAEQRSALAKEFGLGQNAKGPNEEASEQAIDPQEGYEPRRRGRPRKSA